MISMQQSNKQTSLASIEWLEYENTLNQSKYPGSIIRHAYNYGEQKVAGYFVDGYLEIPYPDEPDKAPYKIAYEYEGCHVGLNNLLILLYRNKYLELI